MSESEFELELERRLQLLESDDGCEGVLDPLPRGDLWWTIAVLVVLTVVLLWWGYPA